MEIKSSEDIRHIVLIATVNFTTYGEYYDFGLLSDLNSITARTFSIADVNGFIEELKVCLQKLGVSQVIDLSQVTLDTSYSEIITIVCSQLGISPALVTV